MNSSTSVSTSRICPILFAVWLTLAGCAGMPPKDTLPPPPAAVSESANPQPPSPGLKPSPASESLTAPVAEKAPPPLRRQAGPAIAAPVVLDDLPGGILPAADDEQPVGEPDAGLAGGGTIEFNFDNAELNEVIRTLADILEIQYLADPNLQGKVTIHTSRGMSREDLFPVFFKILEVNGLTAIKDGPIYRITAVKDASRLPLGFRSDSARNAGLPPDEQVIIQIIPLRNLSPTEMTKILTPFVSDGATIAAHEASGTLLVVDKRANIQKIIRMVQAFDLNVFSRVNHRFYFLENAVAKDTSGILQEIFASGKDATASVRFVPIERLNAILVVSADPDILTRVDPMMVQLDAPGRGTEPRIYVYFVRNGTADELAALLNQVYTGRQTDGLRRDEKADPAYGFSRNPFARQPKTEPAAAPRETTAPPAGEVPGNDSDALRASVTIIPDPIRNALVIEATPVDYKKVEAILDRIDVLPRQVLIEATIAEIGLDDRTDLGVEWEYLRENNFSQTELVRGTIDGTGGLTYAIEFSKDVLHTLEALARKNKVNILSSPHVLASDNKEAKIDVSNEIPIVSSETTVPSGAEPIITTDIQYRDTGVLLSVTPHINERGLVTMEIFQEVSEQADSVEVAGVFYPSFFKRTVNTTLTVRHGQTIVLGGLIRENKTNGRSGVPLLMDIPVLGVLFGSRSESLTKTELIILLTPRVIDSLDDVAAVTEEFERKVSDVMRTMKPQM
ncbi:MAG: type II secretion system secretin GspD [Desulfobacterales bacterium]